MSKQIKNTHIYRRTLTHTEEAEGRLVLCKTPRVSVFGPHTRESLAEAKWMKVNKSGHYVWTPVNSCSLVSVLQKEGRKMRSRGKPMSFLLQQIERGLALLLCLPFFKFFFLLPL